MKRTSLVKVLPFFSSSKIVSKRLLLSLLYKKHHPCAPLWRHLKIITNTEEVPSIW